MNSAVLRLPNSFAPSPGVLSGASIIIAAKMIIDTDAPSARSQYVKTCRASARSSRSMTGRTVTLINQHGRRARQPQPMVLRVPRLGAQLAFEHRQDGHGCAEFKGRWPKPNAAVASAR